MIPLELRVRNFMCYRDNVSPLDLRGIHLACLTGDNGHGKSAILDAMTWVLWGKARVTRDDQLIHLGQTEMEVELEFKLGPHRYRVIRKRDSRRGQSALELQGWAKDHYLPLTETSIRQTQTRIIDLLRMDYETFINSAFLVQGRADEFTTKPPGERKRILGEILGLNIYDEYAERAKARAKAKAQVATELTAQIREIDRELDRLPEYETQLLKAEKTAAKLDEQLRHAEEEQKQLQVAKQGLLHQLQQLDELRGRVAQRKGEVNEGAEQLQAAQLRVTNCEETLAQQDEIEAKYAELLAARELADDWNDKLIAQRPLMEERHQLDKAIGETKGKLSEELGRVKAQVDSLSARVRAGEIQETPLAEAQAILTGLEEQQEKREVLREKLTAMAERMAMFKTRDQQLRVEMTDLQAGIELLREIEGAVCPLCQQPLDKAHRKQLLDDLRAQGRAKGDLWRENQSLLKVRAGQEAELRKEDETLARALNVLPARQRKRAEAWAKVIDGKEAAQKMSDAQAELVELQTRLEKHDFARKEQALLATVLTRLEELGYDEVLHGATQIQANALSDWEMIKRELDRASEQVEMAREQVITLQERQNRWQEALAVDEAKQKGLVIAVNDLPEVSGKLAVVIHQVEEIGGQAWQARLQLGAARQRVDTCDQLVKGRETKRVARQQEIEIQTAYEELREAFGRRGLQAMIIEAAVPEIETEANRLLSRMSDGCMTVRLDTQRETKKGTTQETLDIIISDELGSRDYKLFSGGEAFRINFALRIAISKLLARRTGAQLRTLFIDEGFGTQDAQGRERLVEAINAIKEGFDRILVITHIEELKNMFPVRIDVIKTSRGSQISLSG